MGARVILHGRNRAKVKPVLQEIEQKTGNDKLDFFIADLSSLEQIRSMVHSSSLNFDNLAEPRCFDGWEVYC